MFLRTIQETRRWLKEQQKQSHKRIHEFTDEELDYMWDDDTIDIKNFSRMEEGSAKQRFRQMLKDRMEWYYKQGLVDWAEQIDVGLWSEARERQEREENQWVFKCTDCNKWFRFPNKGQMFQFMETHSKNCKG